MREHRFPSLLLGAVVLVASAVTAHAQAPGNQADHAIAMLGSPKYAPDFTHFDYVNPTAPKGGKLRLHTLGSFDSLNPYIVRGKPAVGVHHGAGIYFETLAKRSRDEPFTLYGLLAESITTPEDRAWVEFVLRPEAQFSDGSPVTVADVMFSWETLKTKGLPNARATWSRVAKVEATGERKIRFTFADGQDRELPLLVAGFMPILSKSWWATRTFNTTTLEPPLASGPYVIDAVDPGRAITYRRNPNYWGARLAVNAGQHNFDEIRYDYFRDAGVAFEAFKAGDYDLRFEGDATRWATQYAFPAATDGRITRSVLQTGTPSGLNALTFNLRKPRFQNLQVRTALAHAFDFEWVNKTLLHDGYVRTASMFTGSDLAPRGAPDGAELALLEPWRGKIPDAVFGPPYAPPHTDGSGRPRANLKKAAALLGAAGWKIVDGRLQNANGNPFQIEITIRRPSNTKIALAYARNLKRLGIEANARPVESAQFQGMIDSFDFDMVFGFWGVTLSPGNEQQNYWSQQTANQPGGRNWAGVADPAVDAMIDALGAARNRAEMVAAARALDRILMWNRYVLPLYHDPGQRLARWARIARPETIPVYGLRIETLWADDAN